MRVICDSSVLIPLALINQLHLLEQVFGEVLVPSGVYDEVVLRGMGRAGTQAVQGAEYIRVESLHNPEAIADYEFPLSAIDAEVIVLAKEQNSDLIMTRDRGLRRSARREGIEVISLFDFFIVGKQRGLIQMVRPLLDNLINNEVLIREGVYRETLRQAGELED